MSTETLLKQLEEYESLPCSPGEQEHRKLILQILKQQQQTISEQNALIETLWAWAEERDEPEQKTQYEPPTEYEASVYTQIM